MKLRITRPDGTIIDVEGTPEECERFAPPAPVVSPQYDQGSAGGIAEIVRRTRETGPAQQPLGPYRWEATPDWRTAPPWWRDGEIISIEVGS